MDDYNYCNKIIGLVQLLNVVLLNNQNNEIAIKIINPLSQSCEPLFGD